MQLNASLRCLLVPVSERPALAAVPYAVGIARAMGARIVYLHVSEPEARTPPEILVTLERLCQQSRNTGIECGSMTRSGPLRETICEIAAEIQADLVLLSRSGSGETSRRVQETLLQAAAIRPVLVVPEAVQISQLAPSSGASTTQVAGGSPSESTSPGDGSTEQS